MPHPPLAGDDAATRAKALVAAWVSRAEQPDGWQEAWRQARSGPNLHPGEIVAEQWLLLESAGAGPLVHTWRGWDLGQDEPAILKVLVGQHCSDPAALGAFDHAQGERGHWQGFEYLVRPGDVGSTLAQAMARGLSLGSALQATLEAGQALAGMHAVGIVHGLVSPDTIRMSSEGAGLDDVGLNTVSSAAGTPWMAPERMDANGQPTPAADVYGLAMSVLCALSGGDLPFWAWRDPERLVDSLAPPAPAFAALKRAVQWDPTARTIDARELTNAVLDTLEYRDVLAEAATERGDQEAAHEHLAVLAAEQPDNAAVLLRYASALEATDQPATEPWLAALAHHHTRDQARTALTALTRDSEGLRAHGLQLAQLETGAERAAVLVRVGHALLDDAQPEHALTVFEQALQAGAAPEELGDTIHALRSQRGDWPDVVRHLSQLEGTAAERSAALQQALNVARMALREVDEDLARAVVEHVEDPHALRLLALEEHAPLPWLERLVRHPDATASDRLWFAHALDRAGRSDEVLAALEQAHEAHPSHVGLTAALARRSTDPESANQRWGQILDALSGSGHPLEAEALEGRANHLWRCGRIPEAAEAWHQLLDLDPDDRRGWWGLVKVAWAAPEDCPWLDSTPEVFPPEEALGQLLCGLLEPTAVRDALDTDTPNESPLALCAQLVDQMAGRDHIGPGLFTALADHFPEAALAIEAVRWLWCEPPAAPLFEIDECYGWSGQSHRFDPRVDRSISPVTRVRAEPQTLPAWLEPLVNRTERPLPIEAALTGHAATGLVESESRRWVVVPGGHAPVELEDSVVSLGGHDADTVLIEAWEPERVSFEPAGASWYLVSRRGAHLDGSRYTERRLEPGQVWAIDGIALRVYRLEPDQPVPEPTATDDEDDLILDFDDEATVHTAHAKLLYRDGVQQTEIPFMGRVLALGPDPDHPVVDPRDGYEFLLRAEEDGTYTLEEARLEGVSELPPILPLKHGDTFVIADRSFTFEHAGMAGERTPTHPGSARRLLPVLLHRDGSGPPLPIVEDVLSIGRGQGNDLWLQGDVEASRQHCTIVRGADGSCVLRDNGSANGTYVNGRVVERHILQVGDLIQVGGTQLEFQLGKREELEEYIPEVLLELVEVPPTSRVETMAIPKPNRQSADGD